MNNNDSPLIPQGSFLEQKNKGRARVRIAVFVVLAIHGIGLMALLMQGCKPNVPPAETASTETNATAVPFEPTNLPSVPDTNLPAVAPAPAPVAPETAPTVTAPAATEYKIVRGDTLAGLAKKFGVSLKALMDANPGVDATKLQIGQTIKIPAATAQATPGATTTGTSNGMQLYKVQSGDTLIKIASKFGVSVKAISNANNLTTSRIRVGETLKIPAKPMPPAFAAPGSNSTAPAPDTSAPPVPPSR